MLPQSVGLAHASNVKVHSVVREEGNKEPGMDGNEAEGERMVLVGCSCLMVGMALPVALLINLKDATMCLEEQEGTQPSFVLSAVAF